MPAEAAANAGSTIPAKKKQVPRRKPQPPDIPVKVMGSGIRVAEVFQEPVKDGSFSRNPLAPGSSLEDMLDNMKSKIQQEDSTAGMKPCPFSTRGKDAAVALGLQGQVHSIFAGFAVKVHAIVSKSKALSIFAAFAFGTAFALLADLLKKRHQKRNSVGLSKRSHGDVQLSPVSPFSDPTGPSTPGQPPPSPTVGLLESGLRRRSPHTSPVVPPLQGEKPPNIASKLPPPIPGRYVRAPASPRPPPLPDSPTSRLSGGGVGSRRSAPDVIVSVMTEQL